MKMTSKFLSCFLVLILLFTSTSQNFADTFKEKSIRTNFVGQKIKFENGEELEILSYKDNTTETKCGILSGNRILVSKKIEYLINGELIIHKIQEQNNGDIILTVNCPTDHKKDMVATIPKSKIKNLSKLAQIIKPHNSTTTFGVNDFEYVGHEIIDLRLSQFITAAAITYGVGHVAALINSALSFTVLAGIVPTGKIAYIAEWIVAYNIISPYTTFEYDLYENEEWNLYKYVGTFKINNQDFELDATLYSAIDIVD